MVTCIICKINKSIKTFNHGLTYVCDDCFDKLAKERRE